MGYFLLMFYLAPLAIFARGVTLKKLIIINLFEMKNNRLVILSVCLFAVFPIFASAQTAPAISFISPDSGGVGSQATIYGSNLYGNILVINEEIAQNWQYNSTLDSTGNTMIFVMPSQMGSNTIQVEQRIVGGRSNPITLNVTSSTNFDDVYSPTYSKTSNIPISSTEKVVTYTYPNSPCGTLMTSFTSAGDVFVGNGPVYALALQASPVGQAPDTSTFRTFSCSNISVNGRVLGKATFAFKLKSNDANQNAVSNSLPLIPYSSTPVSQLTQSQKNEVITQIRATLVILIQQLALMLQQGKL